MRNCILLVVLLAVFLSIPALATSYFTTTDDILINLDNGVHITLSSGQNLINNSEPVLRVYNSTDTPSSTLEVNLNGSQVRWNANTNKTLSLLSYLPASRTSNPLTYNATGTDGYLNTTFLKGYPFSLYDLWVDDVLTEQKTTDSSGNVWFNYSTWSEHSFQINSNLSNFTFSDKSISETQIYQSSQASVISATIIDYDGTITNATVGISFSDVETNYTLVKSGDTWSYSFKSGIPGTYTITGFYATDDSGNKNSSAWDQQFVVVPVAAGGGGGGGGGGGMPAVPEELIPFIPKPITIEEVSEDITGMYAFYGLFVLGVLIVIGNLLQDGKKVSGLLIGFLIIGISAYAMGWFS